jgi:hypothetical protein
MRLVSYSKKRAQIGRLENKDVEEIVWTREGGSRRTVEKKHNEKPH